MAKQIEVLRAVEIIRIKLTDSSEITPEKLIPELIAHFNCSFEHARDLIFGALELGMLRLTPSYNITRAETPLATPASN